jgi:ATP-binding cassette subfamily G (WHITE) protein 2 (SNQ2)
MFSTLLDILADRKHDGQWSGNILFNGGPRSKFFERDSAYVLQEDLQIATLTVKESIFFAASFKMPEGTTTAEIIERVDLLLELMCLTHIANSYVGDHANRGISGGQLKRLCIAVEIIALPYIVFLDEPTSGLDSTMAFDVMKTVKRLSQKQRTCIATIHQPSPEVFELFDSVVLLSEGRIVYFGSVSKVMDYFCYEVFTFPFEDGMNPAEFIVEITEGLVLPRGRTIPCTATELEDRFKKSPYIYSVDKTSFSTRRTVVNAVTTTENAEDISARTHATTKWTQFKLLMYRNGLEMYRDKAELSAHFVKYVFIGCLFAIVFNDQADVTTPLFDPFGVPNSEVYNICNILFAYVMYIMMANMQAVPVLISKNLIFKREVSSFAYAVSPYWLAHTVTVIPIQIAGVILFILISYFSVQFPITADYFIYFFFIIFLGSMTTYYYAMFLAAWTGSEVLSFGGFTFFFFVFCAFSGFAIYIKDMPDIWYWAPYADYVRWSFQGLLVNQWADYDDDTAPETVLQMYGFTDYNKNNSYWILLLASLILIIWLYLAMRPRRKLLKKITDVSTLRGTTVSSPLVQDQRLPSMIGSLQESLIEDGQSFREKATPLPVVYDGHVIEARASSIYGRNSITEAPKVPLKEGYYLTFDNVSYAVECENTNTALGNSDATVKDILQSKKCTLRILQNVSGRIEPGEMCSLMGSSGAGKSTLLDILADRKTIGTITGNIYINGQHRTPKFMQSSTAYVTQDLSFLFYLTVRETLEFAAEFRMSEHDSKQLKEQRVHDLLHTLRLSHIADSIVGDEGFGGGRISGGERRRLSIGVEIINLPKLIFLDEPTTGLDSASANEVISAVRILANQQRTVICTIHQPSQKCFMMFDKVLLLGKGQMLYFGMVSQMKQYFHTCIYEFYYKPGRNVADYMMDIGSGTYRRSVGDASVVTIPQLAEMYESSPKYTELRDQIHRSLQTDLQALSIDGPQNQTALNSGWFYDCKNRVLQFLIPDLREYYMNSQYHQLKVMLRRLWIERCRIWVLLALPIVR